MPPSPRFAASITGVRAASSGVCEPLKPRFRLKFDEGSPGWQALIAMPRSAVRQLDQVILVDKDELTLQSFTINPLWSDETNVLVRDESIIDGTYLATTRLVYAPDGSKIEIIPDVPTDDSSATAMVTD